MLRQGSGKIAALAVAALLLLPSASAAQQFGSNLQAAPNTGICPVPSDSSRESSCTFSQLTLADGHAASGGVQPRERDRGVITSFRVASGLPTPGTGAVKVRLRTIGTSQGFVFTGAQPYVDLPLTPGIHEFPTRLAINGLSIGLDTVVTGAPGEATAPLGHAESGSGTLDKWVPSLPESTNSLPTPAQEAGELLFNLVAEPDRDRDEYGDKTQDRCPEDPRRHVHCDRIPPRAKLTFAPRQDVLRTGKVVVYVRSNEAGRVIASGQIDIAKVVTWGIYSDRATVRKGQKRKLVLRVPANAREHAMRSLAHGRPVTAGITAYAVDAVGNESGATVATIKPKR
jgi:hypothetical protein